MGYFLRSYQYFVVSKRLLDNAPSGKLIYIEFLFFLIFFSNIFKKNPWLYTMAIQIITLQFLIFCLFAELVNTKVSLED